MTGLQSSTPSSPLSTQSRRGTTKKRVARKRRSIKTRLTLKLKNRLIGRTRIVYILASTLLAVIVAWIFTWFINRI